MSVSRNNGLGGHDGYHSAVVADMMTWIAPSFLSYTNKQDVKRSYPPGDEEIIRLALNEYERSSRKKGGLLTAFIAVIAVIAAVVVVNVSS